MVLTQEKLNDMRDVDIRTIDRDSLVEIKDVKINMNLPQRERILDFIKQIKNPYCYNCGDLVIKIAFSDTEVSLQERMENYLISL